MAKISSNKENEPVVENGKKKKEEKPATKVVVRRLPPTMTEEQFKMQVSPLPDNDYFYYVPGDKSLTPNAFCRAYINFINQSDLFIFTQKFDGYVFVDSKGVEYPAVVEFAPFQRIPKNRPHRRKDPKTGTIESDPLFIIFQEHLEAMSEESKASNNASKQHFFETSLLPEKKESNNTPLIDFIRNKRAEKQRIRDEKREEKRKKDLERRKAKEEQKRIKKEDETPVVKLSTPSPIIPNPKDPIETVCHNSDLSCSRNKNIRGSQIMDSNLQNKLPTPPNIETNEQNVTKKVRDLVSLFNQSLIHNNTNEPVSPNNTALLNCVNHKDVETQIMKNADINHKRGHEEPSTNHMQNKWYTRNARKIPLLTEYNEINYICPPQLKVIPLIESRPKVFVQRPIVPCRQPPRNIVMKPVPVVNNQHNSKKDSKIENNKKGSNTVFHSEVFRRNLQKVVEDVLGHSKVKSPREYVACKPKTFVRRAYAGAGDTNARPGVNFYLPPRTFGFGQGTPISKAIKEDPAHSVINHNLEDIKSMNNISSVKSNMPIVPRKNLPPFSNKTVFSSKSDGEIDKNENCIKVGGSEETFKTQSWASDLKQVPFRRPHVTPKKSVILEKTTKVSL